MTKYLFVFSVAISVLNFQAQLKLIDPTHPGGNLNNTTLNISGVPADNDLDFALSVINTSSQSYTLKCRRTEMDVLSGTTNTTCWVLCPPYVDAGDYPIMVIGQNGAEYTETIASGDTAIGFLAHYGPNNLDGCSLFKYEFFDESNPANILGTVNARFSHNVSTSCMASFNEKNELKISMFPNPVDNILEISTDIQKNMTIQLIDMLGKTVVEQTNFIGETRIDVSNIINGVYFVSILNNGTVLKTEKLIVSH